MKLRLLKIKRELRKQNLDAILVSSVPNIAYLTGYSGFSREERGALLLITANEQYVLTDKRYKDELPDVILSEAKDLDSIFKLEEVSSSIPFRIALEKLIKKHNIKKLGIEVNDLKVAEYITLKKIFKSGSVLISYEICENRIIKEKKEIDAIQKACALTDRAFNYVLTKIKTGITEKELAFEIEFFIKSSGGDLAFEPIVAFGKNSAIPHHKTSNQSLLSFPRKWESNSNIILLDFGAKVDNYCSDMTRVVFLGKATEEQKRVYQIVLDAQERAIEFLNRDHPCSGMIPAKNVDKVAHDYIRSKGFRENIFHSLGHGVGLEIHESPRLSPKSKETLKPGMVFTIEPGIYIPEKFGIRIEDTAVLEKNGLRLLTHSPKSLIEL